MNKYLVFLTILLTLSACGGSKRSGSGDPGTTDPGTTDPTAVWTGSVNTTDKGLAITRSGEEAWFLLMDSSYIPQTLAVFANGPVSADMDVAGTLYPLVPGTGSAAVLSGTLTEDEHLNATINGATWLVNLTPNGYYATSAAISTVVGSWAADYGDEGIVTIHVEATGNFSAVRQNNPGCTFGGSLTADPDIAIFNVVFDETPCAGVRLEGLGLIAPIVPQERIYLLLRTMDDQAAVFMGVRQ